MNSTDDTEQPAQDRDAAGTEKSIGQLAAEPDVWKKFLNVSVPEEFARYWLILQCSFIEGINGAVVVLGKGDSGPFHPAAKWPEGEEVSASLTRVAEMAMKERRGIVQIDSGSGAVENGNATGSCLAYPFLIDGSLFGVIAVEIGTRNEEQLQLVMRKLQWGCSWIEVLFRREKRRITLSDSAEVGVIMELIATVLDFNRFQAAANSAVTEIAIKMKCERVSIGFIKGKNIQLTAVSHSAHFNKKSNFIRIIEGAMEEAVDQKTTIVSPPLSNSVPGISRVHEELLQEHNVSSVCTVPFVDDEKIIGTMTFERSEVNPLDPRAIDVCETVAQMLGPILDVKRANDQNIFLKIWHAFIDANKKLLGPRQYGLKLAAICLFAVTAFFSFATTDYRVSANTRLEGAVQRVVVSPLDGYVAEADVRAGDIVHKGGLIVRFDDKDLNLERLKWKSEQEKYLKQYREALAKDKRAEIRVLKAQLGQAQTQLELVNEQLSRTRVKAPFDGVVVSGDLSQSLGAPVERGDVLFEIAPLKGYRVILMVDERDVSDIKVGQQGEMVLSGEVDRILPFTVNKITPVSQVREGRNYFRVEAKLSEAREFLRPGMRGVGKINIGRRKLFWVLTHQLTDWLQLKFWTWTP